MASTNVSFEYQKAEAEYLETKSDEERLAALEKMWTCRPQHKGAESLRANIRTRIKKLKEKLESKKQKRKALKKEGIKKEGIQVILIGLTQSGKSSLLTILTNAHPLISNNPYTTKTEILGSLKYEGIKFQIIDTPAVNHGDFDQGLANSADILLIIITSINQLNEIFPFLEKSTGKKIIVFNKIDSLTNEEKRKISAFLQSKKYNFVLISTKTGENIEQLKEILVQKSGVIRIYTKQPGKPADREPVIMKPKPTVEELAKKIFHSDIKIKEIRITGPSSKFPNQITGLKHILKDKDIVEFHTN